MGKQINYYMEYESFLKIAEKALSMGLIIIKEEDNRIIQSKTISSITKDCIFYHFYMPSIGSLKINDYGTHQAICSTGIYGNALIEAGFSHINHDGKSVVRNRIYVQSGYYDENGEWKERSEELTKAYNTLARLIRKIAPYTELLTTSQKGCKAYCLQNTTYKHKEYITQHCLELNQNEGYTLK